MTSEPDSLRAAVQADLPWHTERAPRGTLRIAGRDLVVEGAGPRVAIPLASITRASVERAFGLLPALHVWHRMGGQEVLSRFEFTQEGNEAAEPGATGLADRLAPGPARDAAQRLEGGLRALSGGLNQGRRVARQAVEGLARQEELRLWPAAIARAQAALARREEAGMADETRATPPAPVVPLDVALPSGEAGEVFRWFRERLLSWVAECARRARALGVQGVPIIQPLYPLDSPICRIVVAGEFSRGKSTLINALFGIHGEIALPTGMTPTTPLACALRVPNVGEADGATITYRTARPPLELTLDEFRAGVRLAEEGDPGATLHLEEARRVEVRITGAYLPAGVEIEDTPGLNEQAGRSAGALAALGRADLVLFVLAADQLLGDLERETIERVLAAGHHRNVLFLVNFWESIDDEAQRAILRERAETLLRGYPMPFGARGTGEAPSPHIHYISALQAARAQRRREPAPEESGIPRLRGLLRELLGPQSGALLLRARAGRTLRYVDLLQHAVSRDGAQAALAGEEGGPRDSGKAGAALAAALRLLEGLEGAIQGATARPLAVLREHGTPGLQRLAVLLDRDAGGSAPSQPELAAAARRTLLVELRTATAACAQAAQQAVDLVLAQARAAFPAHGLPAPPLDARIELPSPVVPEEARPDELRARLDGAAESIEAGLRDVAERLRRALADDLRAGAGQTLQPEEPTAEKAASTRAAEARARAAALRSLEEDLLRLRDLLRACLRLAPAREA